MMSDRDEVFKGIVEVLQNDFEMDAAKLKPEARLFEDLDLDSIDAVDLIVRLQQRTGLKVRAEDFKTIKTLGDVAGVIANLAAEQGK